MVWDNNISQNAGGKSFFVNCYMFIGEVFDCVAQAGTLFVIPWAVGIGESVRVVNS